MSSDNNTQSLAQEGLRQIETAILRLLDANPQGLRNADIARILGLNAAFRNRQRDYLTYSVLGGLMARGQVAWNQETKVFTRQANNVSPEEVAHGGLRQIEDAILHLLNSHPQGLRNTEIARLLNLRSDFRGRQRDYLTYSVLGGLLAKDKVSWNQETKIFTQV